MRTDSTDCVQHMSEIARQGHGAAYLELRQRKALPQARPWSVHKRQQMRKPLDLPRLRRDTGLVDPALRHELLRVRPPERLRAVHAVDGYHHRRAFRNRQTVHRFAGCRRYWRAEGDDVVFQSLDKMSSLTYRV